MVIVAMDDRELEKMRQQAAFAVFSRLPADEQAIIRALAMQLRDFMHHRCQSVRAGDLICLEILAAIGQKLSEAESTRNRWKRCEKAYGG